MNTFLLNADNQVIHTVKSPVMEKSNCIEDIQFVTDKEYNGYLMEEFDFILEYLTPISKTNRFETLKLVGEYKTDYLLYTLPSTTTITGERGEFEMNLSFVKTELDSDGNKINRVRNFSPVSLNIVPVSSWLTVKDEGLTQLAELYLNNKSQIEALTNLASIIYDSKADDISINIDGKKLQLKEKGESIGEGISLEELNQELVETGRSTTGNVNIIKI